MLLPHGAPSSKRRRPGASGALATGHTQGAEYTRWAAVFPPGTCSDLVVFILTSPLPSLLADDPLPVWFTAFSRARCCSSPGQGPLPFLPSLPSVAPGGALEPCCPLQASTHRRADVGHRILPALPPSRPGPQRMWPASHPRVSGLAADRPWREQGVICGAPGCSKRALEESTTPRGC